MSQGLTSMPDRPAGAVEGAQDTVALETSALEAMMAAVLFRPAPVPRQVDVASTSAAASDRAGAMATTSAVFASQVSGVMLTTSEAVASRQAVLETAATDPSVAQRTDVASGVPEAPAGTLSGIKPTMTARDASAAVAGVALAANVQAGDRMSSIELPAVTPDTVGEAMRVAVQAGQRSLPARTKWTDTAREVSVMSESDIEAMSTTMGSSDDGMASAVAPPVSPAETASTPLGLLEDMSDVEAVEVFTSTVRAGARAAAPADDAEPAGLGDNTARAALVSGLSSITDAENTVPVAAAKVGGVQSLPVAAQVAETVQSAVLRGDHEIRLLLNPGDLGRIDIRITEQHGVLQLNLNASHGSTRDLLAREMPVLQQALEARDLRVERIQVSHSGSASSDGSGAAWQQGFGRQGQQQGERDGSPAWSPVASLMPSGRGQQEAHRAPRVIRHHGVLDRVA
ncbi:MAG: flagellar hook-length control protein FliK [Dehalococcoidia bacterium]|nr:MAG: flagellar hook-length control protein FliK [Dehalococcoidia bacterium]